MDEEYIISISEVYSSILMFELKEMWISFKEIEECWNLELRAAGIEKLPEHDRKKLDAVIADKLSAILDYEDSTLLSELKAMRASWLNQVLVQASKLLDISQQAKLKKMVILQNIATGSKPSQKPWENKVHKPLPKRREPTEKTIRKELNLSIN